MSAPAEPSAGPTRAYLPALPRSAARAAIRREETESTVKHHLANARSKVGAETTAQLVWILAARLPEPDGMAPTDDQRSA